MERKWWRERKQERRGKLGESQGEIDDPALESMRASIGMDVYNHCGQ